jgi:hypothetical protein
MLAWVARQVAFIDPKIRATCAEWQKGTEYTWRDVAISLMLGTYLEIIEPDGTVLRSARLTNPNPQYILDLITQVPGSLIYRDAEGWKGLPRSTDGKVLALNNGLPSWQPSSGGAGGVTFWATALPTNNSTTSYATKGTMVTTAVAITVDKIATYIAPVSGATYKAAIYALSTLTITAVTAISATQAAPSTTPQWLIFDLPTPTTLNALQRYAIVLTRTDATNTTNVGLYLASTPLQGILLNDGNSYFDLAKKSPSVGDVGTTGSGPFACCLHITS